MSKLLCLSALLLCASIVHSVSLGSKTTSTDNPVRRVVTMLQSMKDKVEEKGKRDKATHEKFMCYCRSDQLEKDISAAEARIPQLESAIQEGSASTEKLEADIEKHKKDMAAAESNIKEVTSIREKQASEFENEFDEKSKNVAALTKAIAALKKGAEGFLQTSAATLIQRLSIDIDMNSDQRDELTAFLSQKQDEGYTPQSGDILGILDTMKIDMEKDMAEIKDAEEQEQTAHEKLVAIKTKEIEVLREALTHKQQRLGDSGVEIQTMKEELVDLQESLNDNRAFLRDKEVHCATAEKDYEAVKKTRNEELLALSMTIKILNDDEALEIFKKTLPSASLLQLTATGKQLRRSALEALSPGRRYHDSRLDLVALVLHTKKASFNKVMKMIDNMVALLDKEQHDDDSRKEVCHEELDDAEDKLKVAEAKVKDFVKAIKVAKSKLEQEAEDAKELAEGIKQLDKDVAEATATRKEEHDNYEATLSQNKAAKDILLIAKNRLNKFYNPALAKDEIAPDFVQLALHSASFDIMDTPPKRVQHHETQSQDSAGVIEMINTLIADLDREIVEQNAEEKDAQADYEAFIGDSRKKRTKDGKLIKQKGSSEADGEMELQKLRVQQKAKLREAYAATGVLGDLHEECDWLLMNYDTRKEARATEKDSLVKAKAVLAGMD